MCTLQCYRWGPCWVFSTVMILCHVNRNSFVDRAQPHSRPHYSYDAHVSQNTTRGWQRAVHGFIHSNNHRREGRTVHAGGAEVWSLVKSPLQDALEWEGEKLVALATVELVLELHPERKRQTERAVRVRSVIWKVWQNIPTMKNSLNYWISFLAGRRKEYYSKAETHWMRRESIISFVLLVAPLPHPL